MEKEKKTTIKDMAAALGISTAAVSKALAGKSDISQDLRDRVKAWAAQNGYVPDLKARSLATGTSCTMGVLLLNRFGRRVREYFGFHLLDGLLERCQEEDFDLVLLQEKDSAGAPLNYLEQARRRGVSCLVVFGIDPQDPQGQELASSGLPLVSVDTPLPGETPLVTSDQSAAMSVVMDHVVSLGHKNITYLGLRGGGWVARQRLEGVLKAGSKHQVNLTVMEAVLDVEGGRAAALQALVADPRPTALICGADLQAYGAVLAARSLGLSVPGDLSITGFDDLQASALLDPPLTTVAQDPGLLGHMAGDLVLNLWKGKDVSQVTLVPTELIIRSSTRSIL